MNNSKIIYVLVFLSINLNAKSNSVLAGDLMQAIFPIASMGLTISNDDPEGKKMFYKSAGLTIGTTYFLKILINKKRPNGGGWSFPSGHTSWAFSNAAFMQRRYGNRVGIPAYLLASFVGWSRLESKNHYWNDVIWGAVLGTLCSYLNTNKYTLNSTSDISSNHFFLNLSIKI